MKILIVDDELMNLTVLEEFLEDTNFETVRAENGKKALDCLQEENFDLILLDRMMPEMDGMEVLKQLKSDSKTENIPVIMQTALADHTSVAEGIEAGVFYYLTKPFTQKLLLSVINAALESTLKFKELSKELSDYDTIRPMTRSFELQIRTLKDIQTVTPFVASFYPNPKDILIGINELLLNAVEHGNVEISYDEKTEFLNSENLIQEVNRRLDLPEFIKRTVKISWSRTDQEIVFYVKDEGKGFNWKKYMTIDPDRAFDNHGRGIVMTNSCFDSLEYLGKGNEVKAYLKLS